MENSSVCVARQHMPASYNAVMWLDTPGNVIFKQRQSSNNLNPDGAQLGFIVSRTLPSRASTLPPWEPNGSTACRAFWRGSLERRWRTRLVKNKVAWWAAALAPGANVAGFSIWAGNLTVPNRADCSWHTSRPVGNWIGPLSAEEGGRGGGSERVGGWFCWL